MAEQGLDPEVIVAIVSIVLALAALVIALLSWKASTNANAIARHGVSTAFRAELFSTDPMRWFAQSLHPETQRIAMKHPNIGGEEDTFTSCRERVLELWPYMLKSDRSTWLQEGLDEFCAFLCRVHGAVGEGAVSISALQWLKDELRVRLDFDETKPAELKPLARWFIAYAEGHEDQLVLPLLRAFGFMTDESLASAMAENCGIWRSRILQLAAARKTPTRDADAKVAELQDWLRARHPTAAQLLALQVTRQLEPVVVAPARLPGVAEQETLLQVSPPDAAAVSVAPPSPSDTAVAVATADDGAGVGPPPAARPRIEPLEIVHDE